MYRRREEHPEHREPAGAHEPPPGGLGPGCIRQMLADRRRHLTPAAELSDAHDPDRRQPDQYHCAVDQVGDRRAPEPAKRHVGGEDDRRHHDTTEHRQRGERAQDDADDVGLDQVNDGILGLHAETGQPLAPPVAEADREQLTDGVQLEASKEHAEEQPHDRERQEGVDAIPPQVPDPAADDVPRHTVGAGATDPGAGDTDRDQRGRHPATGHRPAGRARGTTRHEAAGDGRRHEIHDDDGDGDGVHVRERPVKP